MSDPKNISPFSSGNKDRLSEEQLLAYLEGKLSSAEQHDVELWLAEEGMESDAVEGLKALQPQETKHSLSKLKHNLGKAMLGGKRKRRPLRTDHITWIAIGIILLLTVVAYLVIRIAK
jgi:hypothetical protein